MANIAHGVTCSNCKTLVTCSGDDSSPAIYGTCPCCSQPATYIIDPIAYKAEQQAAFDAQQEANIAINEAAESDAAAAAAAEAAANAAPPVPPVPPVVPPPGS